jgi:hypothetical protein
MSTLSLPFDLPAPARRPHKRQRATAREVYRRQRSGDVAKASAGKETREDQVLRCLAAHWNATQVSPTALELLAWMRARGESVFDANSVRPRLTALVARGLVTPQTKRPCRVSGETVHTWAVREQGSQEPR